MAQESKLLSSEACDCYISAELPDPILNPELHKLVLSHMIHGPCGSWNPHSPCMQNCKCKNRYPREFQEATTHGSVSYPRYRRRNNVRRHLIDNQWVVPYNPYLLQRYNCHINVEICSTIKLVKYIYKYIYKGPNRVAFRLSVANADNEIEEYQRGRWVGPPEAAWCIYSFDLFEMQPAVIALQLHLPNNNYVFFTVNQDLDSLVSNTFISNSMLTQFFYMNQYDDTAKSLQLFYRDFPKNFVWDYGKRFWSVRKKGRVIGCIVSAAPNEGERYYLRLLLNHVRAPSSYNDLLTFNGRLQTTFREAALARNLLATDSDLDKCLEEGILYQMPVQLRHLFASILVLCSPSNPRLLWERYQEHLCDNRRTQNILSATAYVELKWKTLCDISEYVQHMGKRLTDFQLGPDLDLLCNTSNVGKEISYERNVAVSTDDIVSIGRLNEEQRRAYDIILAQVNADEPLAYFIDGRGGTGKTFLYKAIIATLRSQGHIVLATATSGVAACMLPSGRTAHSRFKLPVHDEDIKIANVTKQSATAQLIREAKLIIWDEALMAHREIVEEFSAMLKDITEVDLPFRNKIVIFGGDFRQVLPVVSGGSMAEQLDASLFRSPLWPHFTQIRLTENMRSIDDPFFAEYLLRVGNAIEPGDENKNITLPTHITIPFTN